MRKTKFNLIAFVMLTLMTFGILGFAVYSYMTAPGTVDTEPVSEISSQTTAEKNKYAVDNDMKAFFVSAADLCADKSTDASVRARCVSVVDELLSLDFNTVVLDTKKGNDFVYRSDYCNFFGVDVVKLMLEAAQNKDVRVIVQYYVNSPVLPAGLNRAGVNDYRMKVFASFCKTYNPGGVLLTDYYTQLDSDLFYEYQQTAAGSDFETWAADQNADFLKTLIDTVHSENHEIAAGVLLDSVWSTKSKDKQGIEASGFSAMFDGCTNTKKLAEGGMTDFIIVRALGSESDPAVPFKTVADWWDAVAQKGGIPMYLVHSAESVCTDKPGWSGYDQLIRQVSYASRLKSYAGSVFYGYRRLLENPEQSTDHLIKYYQQSYKTSDLFKDLIITEPSSLEFNTNEESVRFRGKYDPNFDVTINGQKVVPTKSGEFIADYLLNVGENSFEFNHKGNKITYKVIRKIKVIQSVSPSAPITTDGGSKIIVKAVAYRGASLTANVGGYKVELKQTEGGDDNEASSSYRSYGGVFTAPAAKSYDDTIGSLRVTGTFESFTETVTGSSITVLKAENSAEPKSDTDSSAQNNDTDNITYDLGTQVEMISDHTVVYDSNVTGAAYGSPEKHTLPAGTTDYIAGTVTENIYGDSIKFYKLRSGKKVKTAAVKKTGGKNLGNNYLSDLKLDCGSDYTVLRMKSKWRAGFDISFDGHKYYADGEYVYCTQSFVPEKITVTFDYASGAPKFAQKLLSDNPLFKSASWIKTVENGIPKMKLSLALRNKGKYQGCQVYYTDGNVINFKFNNPRQALKGVKIVLDPGHGAGDSGAVGSYTDGDKSVIVYERDLNLKMAQSIRKRLEAEGAVVYMYDSMSDTTSKGPSLSKRVAYGRDKSPMLYLALHHNSAGAASTGVETYYTNPFSQPLAKAINSNLGAYYNRSMYSSGNRDRGDKYGEFYVTRVHEYSAVLVEYGYISNPNELKMLNSKTHCDGLAAATVKGIKDYLVR